MIPARSLALLLLIPLFCLAPRIIQAQATPVKTYDSQLFFEQNQGQYAAEIIAQSFCTQRQIRFLASGISIALIREIEGANPNPRPLPKYENYRWMNEREADFEGLVWNMHFIGATPDVVGQGKYKLPGYLNYFIGQDSSKWVSSVSRFAEFWYEDLYPQIDVRYYGTQDQQLKYDVIVRPEGDPDHFRFKIEGIEMLQLLSNGDLEIQTAWGPVREAAPYAYQMIEGKEIPIPVQYAIHPGLQIGFKVTGSYNAKYPLIIDPITINWSSFMHTTTSDDYVMAIDRDNDGNVYMAGYTKTLTFPTTVGVYQNVYGGNIDAYVAKLDPGATNLIYASYLGGAEWELAYGMDVDTAGHPFLTGFCKSADFATTAGSVQPTYGGGLVEGFLTRFSPDGTSLIYSTFVGGADRDYMYDVRVRDNGEAYVTGFTYSGDFPTLPIAYETDLTGSGDAIIARYSSDGSTLLASSYFGGSSYDIANSISFNSNGDILICGNTGSNDIPVTADAIQSSANFISGLTQEDGFVVRMDSNASILHYATYMGGTMGDGFYGLDIGTDDAIYLAGVSYSTDFPTTAAAFQGAGHSLLGNGDVTVVKLSNGGATLNYATYIGGGDIEYSKAIRVNSNHEAFVLGATRSTDLPVTSGSPAHVAQYDAFLAVLEPDGSSLKQARFFGGIYNDYPRASSSLYVDGDDALMAVTTHSPDMPMASGGYQDLKINGVSDAPWIAGASVGTVLDARLGKGSAIWEEVRQGVALEWPVLQADPEVRWWVQRRS
ncbi:MAG: hypothetical protein AAFV07_09520, partial [Bacteroidota bacterium]